MELVKKNIHMEQCLKQASMQMSLEEDQNIPDQKPDVFQIVCKKSNVRITESKIQDDTAWVKGIYEYELLYLTDEKEKRLCDLTGEIPFEEKIYTAYPIVNEGIRIAASVEDMMLRLINSRKINIRCIIKLCVIQDKLYDEEIVADVKEGSGCEILKKTLEVSTIVLSTKDIYRIKEEIEIPEGLPNIYKLLWKNVEINGLHFVPMDGKIGIHGEWRAFFLYEGEEEEATVRYFEVVRPINGIMETLDCRENMILCVEYDMDVPEIEIRNDYDGENRIISLETEIKLCIKLYQNTGMNVVMDAYGIGKEIRPVMKECTCNRIVRKEEGKLKIGESIEDKGNEEREIQIINTKGKLLDEKVTVTDRGIEIDGVVHVGMLCKQEDEEIPYRCLEIDIPYQHILEKGDNPEINPDYCGMHIDQIDVAVIGNRIEVRVVLDYQLLLCEKISGRILGGLDDEEEIISKKEEPVMAVYFVKQEESIWDIGKKYRVSLNSLRKINEINDEEVKEGQRILVSKEVRL